MSATPVERGKAMLSTIALAQSKGISGAYPDSSVADVVGALVTEVEHLRDAAQTLGRIIHRHNRDILDITGLHHLIDETGDGPWDVVWETLAAGYDSDRANS